MNKKELIDKIESLQVSLVLLALDRMLTRKLFWG